MLSLRRRLSLLAPAALALVVLPVPARAAPTPAAQSAASEADRAPAPAPEDTPDPNAPQVPDATSDVAPEPETDANAAPIRAGEPLYSLDASRQDAQELILEFARRANQPVIMLDRYVSLASVQFKDLPFEKALRRLCLAADLDFVKHEEGYVVGLPIDLKLRFPDLAGAGETVDATYRCRRIDAATLAEAISKLLGEENIKVHTGPEFLTPPVEKVQGPGENGVNALQTSEKQFRTHDVGFTGKPEYVRRALAMARKFDRPRKQVRVKVRIMQMSSTFARSLGVDWMQSLTLNANEVGNGTTASVPGASGAVPQVNGITLGKFTHSALSLSATLNAMEQSGKTKTLSNPTLLVLDGEKGFILSGVKYVYPKITTKDATGQSVYDVTTEKEGIYLQVGVQVGLDDDMVLTLYPQVTSLQSFQNINGAEYPIINTVEEQATVRALKGEVIVLGGLRQDSVTDSTNSVPFLSHIPVLGKLFSSDAKNTSGQELVFFLTPEIVDDPVRPVKLKMDTRPAPAGPG
jgi:hypothetical protein